MKKDYPVEELRIGMVVADNVYDEKHDILIGKGTPLTDQMIFSLLERPIFSVPILEEQEAKMMPVKEKFVLDNKYMSDYQFISDKLTVLFQAIRNRNLDMDALEQLVNDPQLAKLCKGIRAITQIHNMERPGDYLLHHNLHVGILAGVMGHWMHWPDQRIRSLVIAGLLHDIGKLWIPDEILNKPGKLTDEEFATIKNHPMAGYEFLCQSSLSQEKEILDGVLHHHERNDGSGYPNHFRKEQISDFGHILGILDVYDAMVADRAYAKRSSPFDIFAVISDDIMQGKLDTEYGVTFVKHLCHAMNGNWVRLTTGEKAKIVYIDEMRVNTLPVVQTESGKFYDLNASRDVKVQMLLTYQETQAAN